MSEASDKRKHHRFLAFLEVKIPPGDRVPSDLKLATIDIAVGGARCASNRQLTEDLRMPLSLTLVGGHLAKPHPLDVEVRVLRCVEKPGALESRRYEVALEFVKIERRDRDILQTYLNNL